MVSQIQPVDLVAPGFLGINLSQASNILGPQYATIADNAVIDSAGRLAARSGYSDLTTTDITGSPAVKTLFEYTQGDGSVETLIAWNGGIGNDVSDPEGNDISGAVTDTDGRWWFQNFNEVVLGFQDGQRPIVYNGTGNFATVVESAGTAPTSHKGIGLAAYGRVWGLDSDGQTIRYSDLLDETTWTGGSSGSLDMSSVWPGGMDEVRGLWAFNGRLVVFGKRHIVFFTDGQGSALGVDPANLQVEDVVEGTGLVSQWSIQQVGESDLLFLSPNGVQSLQRVIVQRSNPVTTVSKLARNEIAGIAKDLADPDVVRSAYSPIDGFYLLTFPGNKTYVLDQRFRYQDNEQDVLSIITTWTLAPTAWMYKRDFTLQLGGTFGVGQYAGSTTDGGSAFRFRYQSPWLDLGEQFANRLKILKRIGSILVSRAATNVVYKWSTDFNEATKTRTETLSAGSTSFWGSALWGGGKWSGGVTLQIIKIPARDRGQYFRLGIEADITDLLAIQQLELFTKIGRLA